MIPIRVDTRRVFDILILDISIGARSSVSLTVPEAINLIRKIEEKL
jgi:hypothetical protein